MAQPLPFANSLCHACRYVQLAGNQRGSVFLRCGEPSLPKYGPQPVIRCAKFVQKERA